MRRGPRTAPLPTQVARGGSSPGAALPLAAAAALLLACIPVSVLFQDSQWVPVAAMTVAAVCAVGGILRALPVPLVVVPFAQTAAAFLLLTFVLTPAGDPGTGSAWTTALRDLVLDGVSAVRTSVAPVESSPAVLALLAVLIFLVALLVETLAVGLGLAGFSGAVLLVLAAAPVGIRPEGPLTLLLFGPAAGWVLLMAADQAARMRSARGSGSAEVPGPTGAPRRGWRTGLGLAAGAGAAIVATGVLAGLIAPAAGQTPWLRTWWNSAVGGQPAAGSSVDPFVDVRSRLTGRSGQELLRYRTSDGRPTYLGLVTLEIFDGAGWTPYPASASVPLDRRAPGAADVGGDAGPTVDITVGALGNRALPVPERVTEVSLADDGDWGWDPRTGDAVSTGPTAAGLVYRAATASQPPTPEALSAASTESQGVSRTARAVPPALPVEVADIAADVTEGSANGYERALALQNWLSAEGGFVYSLSVPDPAGRDPLLAFLEDRAGFCQQYATAMAVMARTLGIPARVVVGFAGGTPDGEGGFVVDGTAAHAWPELWFDGIGWVRFEPTPASGTAAVAAPPYAPEVPDAAPAPVPSPTQEQPAEPAAPPVPESAGGLSGDAVRLLAVGLAVSAAGATVFVAPTWIRRRARRARLARLADGDLAAAWEEIGASAVDAGQPWPGDGSVRRRAEAVGHVLGDATAPELLRLVARTEKHLYAPAGTGSASAALTVFFDEPAPTADGDAVADTAAVLGALDGLPRPMGRRLFPRSLARRR